VSLAARRSYLFLTLGVIALDQFTKRLVARSIELHDSREIVSGLASLTHVRNRGAAFGFLSNADFPHQSILFSLLSVVALAAIAAYAFRLPATQRWPQIALALIMGGAVGNLIDRMAYGFVIDFVDVYWRNHHWPAFNVADSCISVGVAMLILDLLRSPAERSSATDEPNVARPVSSGTGE
jgi:signal peptidase II